MGDPYRKVVMLAAASEPRPDEEEEDLRRALRGETGASSAAAHVARIWRDPLRREFLQAFVVAQCGAALVQAVLDVPEEVYHLFCVHVFDVDEFDDRTDLCAWIERYKEDQASGRTDAGRRLLDLALYGGEELLRARFDPNYVIPADRVARAAMTDSFARGRAVRVESGKKATGVATASMRLALDASKALRETNPEDDLVKLLLNLRTRRDEVPVRSIEGPVLH